MNIFFKPAIALMNNLKYPRKLFLIGGVSALAVIILTLQLASQTRGIMEFSNKELLGVEYIKPLYNIMKDIQHYRKIETDYLLGDTSVKNNLVTEREQIDHEISLFEKNKLALGNQLKTNDSWTPIKEKWQSISNIALSCASGEYVCMTRF